MAKYIVSIIIPVLNEARIIKSTLQKLVGNTGVEIIVVDGGSQDDTVNIVRQLGVKVISVCGTNRGMQMNAGAAIALGEILLFLHGDTQLPPNYSQLIVQTLQAPQVVAGAFDLKIDGLDPALRWLERLVKLRSRWWSLPYGDQAIFLSKQVFEEIGEFSNLPIMEDFELIQRLKRKGKIAIAPGAVVTSGRRWQQLGVWKTTLINQLIIIGYYLGVSPTKLRNFYRQQNK